MSDVDIRITVRGKHGAGKSTIIALIEQMLVDTGFKNVVIEDPDSDGSRRFALRHTMSCGEQDQLLDSNIVVEHQQAARKETTR